MHRGELMRYAHDDQQTYTEGRKSSNSEHDRDGGLGLQISSAREEIAKIRYGLVRIIGSTHKVHG